MFMIHIGETSLPSIEYHLFYVFRTYVLSFNGGVGTICAAKREGVVKIYKQNQ